MEIIVKLFKLFLNFVVEEMEHKNRKIKHADEQLKRSGRLLYVLQRRVDELNRHINQKSFNMKPTKKVKFPFHTSVLGKL